MISQWHLISPTFLTTVLETEVDLAEVVVEAEVFPRILHCLRDVDETLGKCLEVTACFVWVLCPIDLGNSWDILGFFGQIAEDSWSFFLFLEQLRLGWWFGPWSTGRNTNRPVTLWKGVSSNRNIGNLSYGKYTHTYIYNYIYIYIMIYIIYIPCRIPEKWSL